MKLRTPLGRKFIYKLYYVTGAAYENNADIFARNTGLLKCSRRGLRTLTSTHLTHVTSNNKELGKPWRVLFFGTDDFSLPSLKMLFRELQDGGFVKQLAVVTSLKAKKNPVRDFAVAAELAAFNWPFHAVPGDFDVGLVSSFGHLISKSIIESFPLGILNVHASLLPRWRGAAPIFYAILNGDSETGVTIMQVKAHKSAALSLLQTQHQC
ncbi:hypothetical protein B7P43_G09285 [Cryptotermes secundus]|uniref:Formyl transferase N-terminal domain-containing protein n=1 Tax=Cryptotermes secundus TaxID=105785 RepID=A0A2J7Q5Y0_9NEOP|nr:hypothetical protein B7P43_G09285 [Cryptotermes secundus]